MDPTRLGASAASRAVQKPKETFDGHVSSSPTPPTALRGQESGRRRATSPVRRGRVPLVLGISPRVRRKRASAIAGAVSLAASILTSAQPARAQISLGGILPAAGGCSARTTPGGDWPTYGHDLSNTRAQPAGTAGRHLAVTASRCWMPATSWASRPPSAWPPATARTTSCFSPALCGRLHRPIAGSARVRVGGSRPHPGGRVRRAAAVERLAVLYEQLPELAPGSQLESPDRVQGARIDSPAVRVSRPAPHLAHHPAR